MIYLKYALIPPLIGFFSKQFVLYSAVQSGYNFMSFVCILVSVISASYYLKIVKVLMHETKHNNKVGAERENYKTISAQTLDSSQQIIIDNSILSNYHSFLISTLTLSILFFIFKPSLILNSTQLLSLSLFNF